MRSGKLRHRIVFERNTPVDNAFGTPVASWAELDTVWGELVPLAGIERFSAMQTQFDVNYMIKCRYQTALASLAPKDRATANSKAFDINAVINVGERNRELHVFVKYRGESS